MHFPSGTERKSRDFGRGQSHVRSALTLLLHRLLRRAAMRLSYGASLRQRIRRVAPETVGTYGGGSGRAQELQYACVECLAQHEHLRGVIEA